MLVSFELAYILYIESVWSTHCVQHNDMYGISDIKKASSRRQPINQNVCSGNNDFSPSKGKWWGGAFAWFWILGIQFSVFSFNMVFSFFSVETPLPSATKRNVNKHLTAIATTSRHRTTNIAAINGITNNGQINRSEAQMLRWKTWTPPKLLPRLTFTTCNTQRELCRQQKQQHCILHLAHGTWCCRRHVDLCRRSTLPTRNNFSVPHLRLQLHLQLHLHLHLQLHPLGLPNAARFKTLGHAIRDLSNSQYTRNLQRPQHFAFLLLPPAPCQLSMGIWKIRKKREQK